MTLEVSLVWGVTLCEAWFRDESREVWGLWLRLHPQLVSIWSVLLDGRVSRYQGSSESCVFVAYGGTWNDQTVEWPDELVVAKMVGILVEETC